MQGIPCCYGSTGEILTEKSGNLNLGIPGVMYVGGICGVIGAFFYEQSVAECRGDERGLGNRYTHACFTAGFTDNGPYLLPAYCHIAG